MSVKYALVYLTMASLRFFVATALLLTAWALLRPRRCLTARETNFESVSTTTTDGGSRRQGKRSKDAQGECSMIEDHDLRLGLPQ